MGRVSKWDEHVASIPKPDFGTGKPLAKPSSDLPLVTNAGSAKRSRAVDVDATPPECDRTHYLPVGSEAAVGKRGVWRYWVDDDPTGDAPF